MGAAAGQDRPGELDRGRLAGASTSSAGTWGRGGSPRSGSGSTPAYSLNGLGRFLQSSSCAPARTLSTGCLVRSCGAPRLGASWPSPGLKHEPQAGPPLRCRGGRLQRGPRALRGAGAAPVGAMVPATGRYAVQGAQVRAGLELWARRTGVRLVVEDDGSRPERAAWLLAELLGRGCRFVLGPYGSDSTRAVATASPGTVVWNHGAAADDVQRLPGVVSLPSPASRYLVALGRAVAALRPGAAIAVVAAGGPFARFAREALEREAPSLGLRLAAFSLRDTPAVIAAARPDAVLACGPHGREVALFRALARLLPGGLLGGVSPGLAAFPELLGGDPEGFIAAVQWHPELGTSPELGPSSPEMLADARTAGSGELDYVAAQAYAVALVATRCLELDPRDPLARRGACAPRPSSAPSSSIPKAASSAATAWRSSAGKGGAGTCSPVEWLVLRGAVPLDLGS